MRGLFIARFQPIHLGHIKVIKSILKETEELIIAIAAAQISHTLQNPLTAGERYEMVRSALINQGVDLERLHIIPVQDILDNALWVHHLRRLLPAFDVMYSNNPFTKRLFEEADLPTSGTEVFEREKFSSTKIREQILAGRGYSKSIENSTKLFIKTWNIRERLQAVVESDQPSKPGLTGSELLKNK